MLIFFGLRKKKQFPNLNKIKYKLINVVHIRNPAEVKRKAITKEKSGFNTVECADLKESLFSVETVVEAEVESKVKLELKKYLRK